MNSSTRLGFSYFSVSLPRVLLQRNSRKSYYAYEIHIIPASGCDEWTILKRYSEFFKLHKQYQDNVAVKTLDFPPKKNFGNMVRILFPSDLHNVVFPDLAFYCDTYYFIYSLHHFY